MGVESRAGAGGDDSGRGAGAVHMSDSGVGGDSGLGVGGAHMSGSILGLRRLVLRSFLGSLCHVVGRSVCGRTLLLFPCLLVPAVTFS